ncbi:MAG TPA: response regulator [Planctomycetaceae bacterium]|nr:response regulator [Planctomycetaceae bacterium]
MARVLVVDDAAVDRRLAGGLLEKCPGIEVMYACNGKEALSELELHVPDLVVTDLQMPEMNGLELVEAIRRDFRLIPVVLMTAQGSEEIAVRALQLGAASYVPKRSLARDLVQTVEQVLSVSGETRSFARLMNRRASAVEMFTLENDLSLVLSLTNYLKQSVSQSRLCEEADLLRVGIALEEALLNAYYHGNLEVSSELREIDHDAYHDLARERSQQSPYRDRRIHIKTQMSRGEAVFVIRDEGQGFNPNELPDPTDPANIDRPCGRGLLLMRTFMDEVRFNPAGNEVTLVKRASKKSEHVIDTDGEAGQRFRFDLEDQTLIVVPRRNITALAETEVLEELDAHLQTLRDAQIQGIVFDFGQVSYFGSSMLEAILILSKRLTNPERMALCNVSDIGREVIGYSRFDKLWPVLPTRSDALKTVRS